MERDNDLMYDDSVPMTDADFDNPTAGEPVITPPTDGFYRLSGNITVDGELFEKGSVVQVFNEDGRCYLKNANTVKVIDMETTGVSTDDVKSRLTHDDFIDKLAKQIEISRSKNDDFHRRKATQNIITAGSGAALTIGAIILRAFKLKKLSVLLSLGGLGLAVTSFMGGISNSHKALLDSDYFDRLIFKA